MANPPSLSRQKAVGPRVHGERIRNVKGTLRGAFGLWFRSLLDWEQAVLFVGPLETGSLFVLILD